MKQHENWTKLEKRLWLFSAFAAGLYLCGFDSQAMHIMEGYLPAGHCIAWGGSQYPVSGCGRDQPSPYHAETEKALILLAMSGAFIFVISSLKIPSVTGSCSHMTGTGLGAILFGPTAVSVLGIIVLLFQAILLAARRSDHAGSEYFQHGNCGTVLSFGIYAIGKKLNWNRKATIFLAACLGDLLTYCVTSIQLAVAYPSASGGVALSAVKFLGVFAPTQLPLAILEGILTVLIIMGMESFAAPELRAIGFMGKEKADAR